MNNSCAEYIARVVTDVERTLNVLLPSAQTHPVPIHELMRYSTFAGGKRIRPALMMAAHEACDGTFGNEAVLIAGAAFEMFHTFSLIHDDLPCMDDDDYRRGKPTAHRVYGDALAVLGGDALCIFAFECLTRINNLAIIRETAEALGTMGMIGGQVVDIQSEGKPVSGEDVEYIHRNKTAALIRTAVRTGAILAGASGQALEQLTDFGNCVGLAFQVVDDILDETATTEQMGKDAGSDRRNGKATFPSVWGMDESRRRATELIDQACRLAAAFESRGATLCELARYIGTRVS